MRRVMIFTLWTAGASLVGAHTTAGQASAQGDDCRAIRTTIRLAEDARLDATSLRVLLARHCAAGRRAERRPPRVSQDCRDARLLASASASDETLGEETNALVAVVCQPDIGRNNARAYYPNGRQARNGEGRLYYPNGRVARNASGRLHFPNGRVARSASGRLYYPNGRVMREQPSTSIFD